MNHPSPLLVDTALVSREGTEHWIFVFRNPTTPWAGLPGHAIVGHFRLDGSKPDWTTFSANPPFVEFFTRYMKGEMAVKPEVLEKAKVGPGEYVYVIDMRTPTPAGEVPFHDIIGCYQSDSEGRPRSETFVYNLKHKITLEDGTPSSILRDTKVRDAVLEFRGQATQPRN